MADEDINTKEDEESIEDSLVTPVEPSKSKKGLGKKEEEIRQEKLMADIASGELKEPSKMTAIRRKVGEKPGPTLREYRSLGAALKESKTSDVDDSRG